MDVSTFAIDAAPYFTVAGVILSALGGFWIVGRILGLVSR